MLNYTDFSNAKLGDIIQLPDGEISTIRSIIRLPENFYETDLILIMGELDFILALSAKKPETISIYKKINYIPPNLISRFEGACRYWAPHLPSYSDAMGELLYRILENREEKEMLIVLYRGEEALPFRVSSNKNTLDFRIQKMPLTYDNDVYYPRHSSIVGSEGSGELIPAKTKEKERKRERVKKI